MNTMELVRTVERAKSLWHAGLNQISISLDYLDERHDAERRIPGLVAKIFRTVPAMRRLESLSSSSADWALSPRIACATRLSLRGLVRMACT